MSSSQASWALLMEGVTSAKVDTHNLLLDIQRIQELIESSPYKEQIYEHAGDLIHSVPQRLSQIDRKLDKSCYALSVLGIDFLKERLPIGDRQVVDMTTEKLINRVARQYLADLMPPLGFPGGPCYVKDRIEEQVAPGNQKENMLSEVDVGKSLSNAEASKIYSVELDRGPDGTKIKKLLLTNHAQYRMDLRGVTVPEIRLALKSFYKHYLDLKSIKSPQARRYEESMMRNESITWTDPKLKLTIAFTVKGDEAALVTTYWEGQADPQPPGSAGCAVR